MWFVILILGLIGAGIYTDNSGFYIAAGVVGVITTLITIASILFVRKASKRIGQNFKDFDTKWMGKRF